MKHEHEWKVAWNDDDVCLCGAWKYWPGGQIVEPEDMTPEQLKISLANAEGS